MDPKRDGEASGVTIGTIIGIASGSSAPALVRPDLGPLGPAVIGLDRFSLASFLERFWGLWLRDLKRREVRSECLSIPIFLLPL